MENLNLKLESLNGTTLTILQGSAQTPLPLKEPKIIQLPGIFIRYRTLLPTEMMGIVRS
jgi:hypothetical protein